MSDSISPLQKARAAYVPKLPSIFRGDPTALRFREEEAASVPSEEIRARFPRTCSGPRVTFERTGEAGARRKPLRIGVVLSGGQAPGGHNVIAGLLDGMIGFDPRSRLFGFLGGPGGILRDESVELTAELVAPYRNTGGFDMIGSGRDKIEGDLDLHRSLKTCRRLELDGLVVIGGDDSNTNAAVLAEYFLAQGSGTSVVGVPKTIDGDLRNESVEQSFGFDTATKVYAELIGNLCRDAASARKYWHFIKLMGRSASHVTLECGLAVRPNVVLIGEEVRAAGMTLRQVVDGVAETVLRRSEAGKNYGVCLVPEGLIEFIPEVGELIGRLNDLLGEREEQVRAAGGPDAQAEYVRSPLPESSAGVFQDLPPAIRRQLLIDRDSHGNVQVSRIDTEKLLLELVKERVREKARFSALAHFFGYEGRCSAPSNFDADYTYSLGRTAVMLLSRGRTGLLCSIRNLAASPSDWIIGGVPITSLLHMESRKGVRKPVIRKALVDLHGPVFGKLLEHREEWAMEDSYRFPGGIQYFGPPEVTDRPTETLLLRAGARTD